MTSELPNILFIFTDQQSGSMMSCTGNPDLHTPALDDLAATGMRFDRAYCANPVCIASRFSLMTGLMPSEINLFSNHVTRTLEVPEHIKQNGLGWLVRRAGYEAAYGGKVHLPLHRSKLQEQRRGRQQHPRHLLEPCEGHVLGCGVRSLQAAAIVHGGYASIVHKVGHVTHGPKATGRQRLSRDLLVPLL